MIAKIDIAGKILGMRALMKAIQVDAYLLTGADPHLSEYTPSSWKTREWISGFTGSYGKVLVTQEKVLLWTDTRYFLQAAGELEGTGIELMKERIPSAVSMEDWIVGNLKYGSKVAADGLTVSSAESDQISSKLTANGIQFSPDTDLINAIWLDRPVSYSGAIYEHPLIYAGKPRTEKIDLVRKMLVSNGCDATIIPMLDDVAWLFNLRGEEIEYIPLFTAYAYIDQVGAWLFIHPGRIQGTLMEKLEKEGINVHPYDSFFPFIDRIKDKRIQIDPIRTNSMIVKRISVSNNIQTSVSATTQLKAIKDIHEIENIRSAHVKDGAAMVNSLYWISKKLEKEQITEISVGHQLNYFRSRQPLFKGDSFHPIVGFGSHGAIVHYHATEQSDRIIGRDNLLLIDSGGQYLDGTTDITRTIGTGTITKKQKEDFTICLKAHIALATAVFPEGTKGYSLDAITRKPLWDRGINYGHGTGHGVGYFLSVHEGPMSIRTEFNNEPIREGHLLSNEPGIYRENEYGLRTENVILCQNYKSGEFGAFLCFETISLCPIDRNLILTVLLGIDEINWINHYHEVVLQKISPLLSDMDVLEWLSLQCAPLDETD
jgi:Xaa-Pro aminopeptidase